MSNLTLDDALTARAERLARALGYASPEAMIADAMDRLMELRGAEIADAEPSPSDPAVLSKIDAGLDAIERGDMVPLDEAMAQIEASFRRKEAERAQALAE